MGGASGSCCKADRLDAPVKAAATNVVAAIAASPRNAATTCVEPPAK
jgi:hypothetical protein